METENFDMGEMQANESEITRKSLTSEKESCCLKNEFQSSGMGSLRKDKILHVLGGIYAEIVLIMAVTALFTEILHGPIPLFHMHVYFYVYLLGLGIIIFILICVSNLSQKLSGKAIDLKYEPEIENDRYLNMARYFQFGIIVCGLAVFICSCLGSIAIFTAPTKCVNSFSSALFVLHSIFITFQLAALFINLKKLFGIFGCFYEIAIMHLIATNAALWLYIVLWESSKDWQDALHVKHNSSLPWGQTEINISMHSLEFNVSSNHSLPKHAVHVTSNCWWRVPEIEISEDVLSIQLCLQNSHIGRLWRKTSDFLYPVIVQYYLIIMFILFILRKRKKITYNGQLLEYVKIKNTTYCFNVLKGLFFGCIIFVASIIIVILYRVFGSISYVTVMCMLCIVFGMAICSAALGLVQIKSTLASITSLNQNFAISYQRVGMCFVYAYSACNLIIGCLSTEKYSLILSLHALLMIFHVVIQYIFILQFSIVPALVKKKSRQLIIFLVFCNASLWILECFIFWNNADTDIQFEIYGSVAWPIIIRILTPCLAFYRFHSAIVLLEASSYSPVELSKASFPHE